MNLISVPKIVLTIADAEAKAVITVLTVPGYSTGKISAVKTHVAFS